MNDLVFLKKDTRTYAVVTSVILAIALLMLVIIGLISGNFLNISVIGSCVVLFIAALFMGSMQIRVFSNYKSQKKYLCADGIFYICLTILVAIASIVFLFAKNAKVDLRYFIFVFILAFAVWKMIIAVLGFKNKYYNAFLELIIAVLWLVSGSAVLMTLFENTEVSGQYLLCVSNYVLGALTIIYILYSYIFKSPDFLITEEGKRLLLKEQEERQQRLNRFNNRFGGESQTTAQAPQKEGLEEKLQKLQNLKDKNFITEEEFEKRKQHLLDEEL